jgi:hypothetical protein
MTFSTSDIAMCAIERKPAFRMIKGRGFPSFGGMTLYARGHAIVGKLLIMDILVTGLTIGANTGELDQTTVTGIGQVGMTLIAGDLDMFSFERKVAFRVIVIDSIPGFDGVAKFTTVDRNQFIHLSAMRIFVTANTAGRIKDELQFGRRLAIRALMASKTGDRLVGATQRVVSLFMLRHHEAGGSEAGDIVTFFAISFRGALGEFAVVKIGVTVPAVGEAKALG